MKTRNQLTDKIVKIKFSCLHLDGNFADNKDQQKGLRQGMSVSKFEVLVLTWDGW